jgi:diguanylate cyclase (GGDEF)-like protein
MLRLGHKPTVAAITAASILMSMVLTALVNVAVDNTANLPLDLVIAFLVPLVIAPLASYWAVGLLFEVEQARAQLQIAVVRDSLTGLYNRGHFLARLREEIERSRREAQSLALILIDVDRFKAINDSFGHAAGDAVLERLGQVLVDALRPYDLIARYGGEEFVALLPGAERVQAEAAAERIRATLESTSFEWGGTAEGRGRVTASLGVTCLGDAEDTADALLARADRAMYAAKNAGRNRCVALPPNDGA